MTLPNYPDPTPATPARPSLARRLAARIPWKQWSPLVMAAVMVVFFFFPSYLGIRSGHPSSLSYGLVLAPFLHANLAHFMSNIFPFLILGSLVARETVPRFWIVTGLSALGSGLFAYFLSPVGTYTVGASGLILGYFAYLIASAVWETTLKERVIRIGVAATVAIYYGFSMVGAIFPAAPQVSWQAHLGGAVGGVLAAWLTEGWWERRGQKNRPATSETPLA